MDLYCAKYFCVMKYFLIAGEASGDLHGANLIRALQKTDPDAEFQFWGGDRMQRESSGLLVHYKDVTIMGFVEVLMNLRTIKSNLELCKNQIKLFNPDRLICIDYPGFNLRIAAFATQLGIEVDYYIAPKIWAWNEKRGYKLERYTKKLLLIFPFEISYFKKWKVNATYVGNPLMDELALFTVDPAFRVTNNLDNRPVIALLPGSRKQEISKILPVMIQAGLNFQEHQLVVAGAPSVPDDFYTPFLNENVHLVRGATYQLLNISEAAVVCSGTATLETALMNVPQVCGYIGNYLSWIIGQSMLLTRYISLVNLCLNKEAIAELIQSKMTADRLTSELKRILPGGDGRAQMLQDYQDLRRLIGGAGASEKAASIITDIAIQA